jgi:hypothetical protein
MATLAAFTGFEFGKAEGIGTGTVGSRVFDGITGTAGTDVRVVSGTPTGGVGSYVGQVALTAKNFFWDTGALGASKTALVVSMRFRFTTLPSGDTDFISMDTAASTDRAGFFYQFSTGKIFAWIGANTQASVATVSVNTWYTLQWKFDCVGTNTLDWVFDGVTGTQVTGGSASTISRLALGNRGAGTGVAQYDDVCASVTGTDHPLAVHQVRMLTADTGGTTAEIGAANSTARFTTNNTIDATHNSANILAALSEVPPTVGASASGVAQRVVGATEAVGIPMTTYTLTGGETLAASRVVICGWANGTAANNLGVRVYNGTAETILTAGTVASNFNNNTDPDWYGKLYTGATTQAHIDALVVRLGYSTDITPQPGAHAVYVELAVLPGAGGATVTPAAVAGVGTVPAPTVSAGSTITATAVPGVGTVPAPTVSGGARVVATAVAGVGTVPAPTVSAGATVTATAVAGVGTVPAPTLAAGATITATVVTGVGAVPAPTVAVGSTVAPAAVTGTGTVPAPTLSAGVTVTATAVMGVGEIAAPSVSAGGSVTVNATIVEGLGSVPQPTVSAGATAAPTTVAGVGTLPDPAPAGGATAAPATVTAVGAVPSPLVSVSALITVAMVVGVGGVPEPVVTASSGATVQPVTVTGVGRVPIPTVTAGGFPPVPTLTHIRELPFVNVLDAGPWLTHTREASMVCVLDAGPPLAHARDPVLAYVTTA